MYITLIETNKQAEYIKELGYIAPKVGWCNTGTGCVSFDKEVKWDSTSSFIVSIYDIHFVVHPFTKWRIYENGNWAIT